MEPANILYADITCSFQKVSKCLIDKRIFVARMLYVKYAKNVLVVWSGLSAPNVTRVLH